MSTLSDLIKSTFPGNGDIGVPLLSSVVITLSGLDYNSESLMEGLFVEGPDTDQFVGPGQLGLVIPNNVSQGNIDDFLQSPGYKGIVQGLTTVSGIAGDTVVTFNPNLPLTPLTEYVVNLTSVLDAISGVIDGFITFSFTAGSGSIEELPANISTSVLSASLPEAVTVGTTGASTLFAVTRIAPADHSVQNPVDLREIVVEFNKNIEVSSVAGNISVETTPATDHPSAPTNSQGDIAISTEVVGNKLKIKI